MTIPHLNKKIKTKLLQIVSFVKFKKKLKNKNSGWVYRNIVANSEMNNKIFLLKPGQYLKIGKGNDCDLILDPPREEEKVIADLHCVIGYDYVE